RNRDTPVRDRRRHLPGDRPRHSGTQGRRIRRADRGRPLRASLTGAQALGEGEAVGPRRSAVRTGPEPGDQSCAGAGVAVSALSIELPEALIVEIAQRVAEILEAERRILSKSGLAQHLGVSERRIKTLREHGLPARKVGRDLYFDLDEVNEWIDREGR